ncbi:Cys-tRNA(Pro) deacylase [Marinobacterium sp. MBR-109]|jgi:Cys-tRNA(Pro)/Cys-tRNA(Cys) deacylase|uniref:Cys-tRNA(Pro) deacylase n=1 Tax=Marinobacterium sp. MBR-109 TaxID=3156462 RepID=UPI00339A5E8C
MTPAVDQARKAGIEHRIHEYSHDPSSESYGTEAAEKLGIPQQQVFKTLVVSLDAKVLAVGIVPVCTTLNLKRIAKAAGAKKATMADPAEVERTTGYVLGGVSPLGLKKRLKTFIDASATEFSTIHVSAGRRGLEVELSPQDLATLCGADFAEIGNLA